MTRHLAIAKNSALLLSCLTFAGSAFAQGPMSSFCSPGVSGVIPCPCSNPPAGVDRGCDNSSATGGAALSATGVAALTADTLVFSTSGERPTATSIVLQASGSNAAGSVFGQGVSCLSGTLKRLYVKAAVGGSIIAPAGSDPSVSARSAALGDPITPGTTRYYAVYYRDPVVLGGCAAASTFNVTQSGSVTWTGAPASVLIAIQPGTFQMGSSAASGTPYFGDTTTQPVHPVAVTYNYWMGAREVTQTEYQTLMGVNPSAFVGLNNPVERVSWFDAQAYCSALTAQQAALGNVPAGYQYRLPTEAEWEYACRAGTTTEFNLGAGLLCSQAQFDYSYHSNSYCGFPSTVAVGSYLANAWGLLDMHGNVREWCLDSYQSYSAQAVSDPFTTGGAARAVRGGGWNRRSDKCRSASRESSAPAVKANNLGFRVVLGPILNWVGSAGPAVVAIQPGTFDLGSNAAGGAPYFGNPTTQPVHQVTISYNFWMGATELTQAQYQALMGGSGGGNHPVGSATWFAARDYCAALTAEQTASGNIPAGYEYRLPTEAEWEYVCRAGTTTEFNIGAALLCNEAKFGYSEHSNSSCNTSSTEPVGSYPPNAWGLYDMHGNVWEWCLDSYADYTAGAVTDPFVTGGFNRVLRGGSWINTSDRCRSAFRGSYDPSGITYGIIGFRVVLAPVLVP